MFILPIIIGSFVIGLLIAIRGKTSKARLAFGISIILLPWIALFLISQGIDEWNPTIKSDSDTHGHWQGDNYNIRLNPDATFSADLKGQSIKGTWQRGDWNLHLTSQTGATTYMRFVEDSGELLLLPEPPQDESFRPGPITRKK
ncbi:MAG: hypothetical protein ACSHYF_08070 [Verrucomicrobiaceae bacterium]